MRKLFAGILLAAALPASASISSELAAGDASVSDIINNAMAACGGSGSCQELAIADAVAAGIDITTVINLAVAAGADAKAAVSAASAAGIKAGKSVDSVLASALAADNVPAADAIGGVTAGATASGLSTEAAQTRLLLQRQRKTLTHRLLLLPLQVLQLHLQLLLAARKIRKLKRLKRQLSCHRLAQLVNL